MAGEMVFYSCCHSYMPATSDVPNHVSLYSFSPFLSNNGFEAPIQRKKLKSNRNCEWDPKQCVSIWFDINHRFIWHSRWENSLVAGMAACMPMPYYCPNQFPKACYSTTNFNLSLVASKN